MNRLIRPGSLKKMLFLTRSPRTCECSMVTRQARGAVPLQTHTTSSGAPPAGGRWYRMQTPQRLKSALKLVNATQIQMET